ncbi:hypothetical protein [Nocardioides sp. LHG3406-4]|uniref:hypothetical protein n=1 Tax=Nocardioides sp. LHG3406-4 TaxID=2804575 RepID=UPI003CEB396C
MGSRYEDVDRVASFSHAQQARSTRCVLEPAGLAASTPRSPSAESVKDPASQATCRPPANYAGRGARPSQAASEPSLLAEPGIRFAIANTALVLTLFATAVGNASLLATTTITAIVATLATAGLALRWRLPIAVVAWALLTGFVVNKYGELTFHSPDVTRLVLFMTVVPAIATLIPTAPRTAPKTGTVTGLHAEVGATVTQGAVICELKD